MTDSSTAAVKSTATCSTHNHIMTALSVPTDPCGVAESPSRAMSRCRQAAQACPTCTASLHSNTRAQQPSDAECIFLRQCCVSTHWITQPSPEVSQTMWPCGTTLLSQLSLHLLARGQLRSLDSAQLLAACCASQCDLTHTKDIIPVGASPKLTDPLPHPVSSRCLLAELLDI